MRQHNLDGIVHANLEVLVNNRRYMGDPVYLKKVLMSFHFDGIDKELSVLTVGELVAFYELRMEGQRRKEVDSSKGVN